MADLAVTDSRKLDPVDYAIISQSLIAAAREMGVKLIRSAYSTVLREARDGSAALLDAEGNTIAQAELIPMQLGTIGHVFRPCQELYPNDTLVPGDFFVINDPYSGGQHLQDVFFFHPIFFDETVIGFSASVAHHLDVSGGDPGLNIAAPDVYAEGLIIPPLKFNMARDWHGGPFQRLLRANVRVPHQTMGDFDAQIAANAIGEKRVIELAERYGAQKVQDVMSALLDYSEARMRAALRDIPDGVYKGEDAVDDDGISDAHLPVCATVTIKGDSAEIDFTGTAAQVRRNLNAPFAATVSAALSCLKAALTSPDIPFNAGAFRPIRVTAPKGSMLNPNHPAPVRARMEVCSRAWNAIMKALSQAVPDKVIACGFDTTTSFVLSHLGETGWSVYLEIYGGGFGAGLDTDGCDGVDNPLSNCSNTPVEALDQDFPFFRVSEYALRTDSCGRGKWRGGLGFTRSFEVLRDNVRVALYSDRFRRSAEGLFGGREGATGFCQIQRGSETIRLGSKTAVDLQRGDVVTIGLGGGGGYGDPAERSHKKIAEDLEDGIVSADVARTWGPRPVARGSRLMGSSADSIRNALWTATVREPAVAPDPFEERTVDVAIIGGGFTGVSAALAAASRGVGVALCEARHIGWGASGRNGGQVIPGLKLDPSEMRQTYGEEAGRRLTKAVGGAADNVFALIEKHEIQCEPKRSGWIQAAHAETALARVQKRGDEWAAEGAPAERLDRATLQRLTGTDAYLGGWIDRRAGTLQPLSYLRGLARAAKAAGAKLHEGATATSITHDGSDFRVVTTQGTLTARHVIVGQDGYADALIPGLAKSLICVQSAQVATEPLPEALRNVIVPDGICTSETRRLAFYFRQSPDGRLVFGGRGAIGDAENPAFHNALVAAMHRTFPATKGLKIEHRWSGQVALTLDGVPHIHEPLPGLLTGLGYNGRGVAMATTMGQWLAAKALDGEAPPLPITPLEPILWHQLRTPAIQLGIAWAWLRDRMGFAG